MKKRKYMFCVIKKSILYGIIIFLMLILSLCSQKTIPAAAQALILCAENIIPSLFPFFVLSRILIKTSFAQAAGKFLSPVMRLLFNISGAGGVAFIIGIISGYPMGAKAVCDLYEAGEISKSEAERLLPFCNNSGPLFIIGAVGTGMLSRPDIGMILYGIHIISAVLTGIFTRFFAHTENTELAPFRKNKEAKSSGAVFSESIKDAVSSTLLVCGFVVFFASLTSPFLQLLPENSICTVIIKGILEVTSGAKSAVMLTGSEIKLCLLSALLGFGGICVLMQVSGIAKESELSLKPYIAGKVFQGMSAACICGFLINKTEAVNVFAPGEAINFETGNFGATITAIFIICLFYLFLLTVRKNFKKY